jgi:hypothetical protein
VLTPNNYGNVAFFPAYPYLARTVGHALHLSTPSALLLTAQGSCWGFWTYLLLLCRRFRGPARLVVWAVLLVALHPASFFLVASYTESLFLLGMLGFIYWSDRPGPAAALLAAGHGFVMTGTRLVGVPLVIYPLMQLWLRWPAGEPRTLAAVARRGLVPALVAAVASLGAFSFFAYCQVHFGHWDLYMKTSEVGWRVKPDYLGLLSPRLFRLGRPLFRDGFLDPDFLSRISVFVYLALFAGLAAWEWLLADRGTGLRERLALYCCAWLLFYVAASGHATRYMACMIRFSLCVEVALALAVLHLLGRVYPQGPPRWARRLFLARTAVSLILLLGMTWRFTHGLWVA